ncbi:obscurin [Galendromus occidentalis]|uniref:Obscurin n=1 Tax=Galendromus occidentalis TaxID=34638 RepID=A0AAJ7SED9_9ACAR|nr:obscurin [Galendromus occidentalis]
MASTDEQRLADELADIDLDDPELAQAASKIQKQFRGFKKASGDSKKLEGAPPPPLSDEVSQDEESSGKRGTPQGEDDELADIDLTDPDLERAAVKIQSTFKGFKTRRAPQN